MIYLYFLSAVMADAGTIQLSGTVSGCEGQAVIVEILRPQDSGQHPLLLWTGVLNDGGGEFSVSIPAQLGDVLLRAAIDVDLNGVGVDDRQTRYPMPLVIGTRSVDGVDILIAEAPQVILEP